MAPDPSVRWFGPSHLIASGCSMAWSARTAAKPTYGGAARRSHRCGRISVTALRASVRLDSGRHAAAGAPPRDRVCTRASVALTSTSGSAVGGRGRVRCRRRRRRAAARRPGRDITICSLSTLPTHASFVVRGEINCRARVSDSQADVVCRRAHAPTAPGLDRNPNTAHSDREKRCSSPHSVDGCGYTSRRRR